MAPLSGLGVDDAYTVQAAFENGTVGSFEDAYGVQRVLDAIQRADETGERVGLDWD